MLPRPGLAGPYPPAAGVAGSTAIPADDTRISGWATGCVVLPGPQQINDDQLGPATYGSAGDALGPADANAGDPTPVVSLGDGGSATLTFEHPITNGAGPDFAVFENSFNDSFLELAFVEVSSDGQNWLRFPSDSRTQTTQQVNGDDTAGKFGGIDPTDLNNLAGKYRAGFGTPFDLSDLIGQPGAASVDLTTITYVRVVDVIGSINPLLGSRDSFGHLVNDPWPTPYETSGFDLDAVGVLHSIPEPGSRFLLLLGLLPRYRRRAR